MARYTDRVQTVLTEEQHRTLVRIAQERKKPVSLLIREAVDAVYLTPLEEQRREVALRKLLALEEPVSDWEDMEAEIIRGAGISGE